MARRDEARRRISTSRAVALAAIACVATAAFFSRPARAKAGETVPLVGEAGRAAEAALEALLAPGEFPGRRFAYRVGGDEALYCIDASLGGTEPYVEVHPSRVAWPLVAGLDLHVAGDALRLDAVGGRVADADLDAGVVLAFVLEPLGQRFVPAPGFDVRLVAVELRAAADGRALTGWTAPAAARICRERDDPAAPRCDMPGASREARAASLSPDGRQLAVAIGGLRPRVEIWDVAGTPRLAWQSLFPPRTGGAVEVAYSVDGRFVVALTAEGRMHRFDAATGGRHLAIPSSGRTARSVPPGRVMAVAGEDGEITLWSLADGTIAWRIPPRRLRGPVDLLAASGDGRRLASLEYDEDRTVVRVWGVGERRLLAQLEVEPYAVADIALDRAGERVLVAHERRGLLAAEVRPGAEPTEIGGDAARRCRARLAWIPGREVLACVAGGDVLELDRDGALVTERTTGYEAGDFLVTAAAGAGRVAAVGEGHLLVWKDDD